MTDIKECTCKHEFQAQRYGPNKRVHNQCQKGWRCTVCGVIKEVSKSYLTDVK